MWWLSLGACWFSFSSAPTCEDPHLWYAPDSSGDVYFGCDKPTGWLETPPDEAAYAVVLTTQDTDVDTGADLPIYGPETPTDKAEPEDTAEERPERNFPEDTAETGDTGFFEDEEELVEDTADTGDEPKRRRRRDTADTGFFDEDTGDTGFIDEETGLPPEDTGEPFEDGPMDGMGGGDTGDTG